jgi:hypothetical protein
MSQGGTVTSWTIAANYFEGIHRRPDAGASVSFDPAGRI